MALGWQKVLLSLHLATHDQNWVNWLCATGSPEHSDPTGFSAILTILVLAKDLSEWGLLPFFEPWHPVTIEEYRKWLCLRNGIWLLKINYNYVIAWLLIVLQRPQLVVLMWSSETFKRWGLVRRSKVIEIDSWRGYWAVPPFLFPCCLPWPWGEQFPLPCTPTSMYCVVTGPMQYNQLTRTKTSKILSQNKPFFIVSYLSQVFCHSDSKLNDTSAVKFYFISLLRPSISGLREAG